MDKAIRMEWLSQLDPEDWDDEIAIIQQILALAFTGKNKEDTGEGENAREEKARPTKAGDYKRFETAPGDGKKVFTESSQSNKDWVLTAESILTDYLLTDPVEEDSAEKQEVEISLDEDGNPEVPTWGGQKLKVQQNLARAVFQAAYAKFTKKPKAKVPWGLLIKSPMEYLDSESIPEGFTMKDPSKWTKADLGLLWDHWQFPEAEEKVIVSFIDCKKEDALLSRQFDRKVVGSSKKRVWVTVDDDSKAEVGGAGIPGPSVTQHSVGGPSEQTVDGGEVLGEATTDAGQSNPEESSPAWHASKDHICYLKSLSIMPRYQVLVDLVDALPEQEHGKGPEVDFPYWATWTWSAKYLPEEIHLDLGTFQKAIGKLQSARFSSSSRGLEVVLGLGLLLRECSHAQEVEEDDPLVSNLNFLLNSKLGVQRGHDVMDVVGVVVSRLEQCPAGTKGPQGGDGGAGMGESDGGDEEKEKEEEEAPPRKRKKAGSGIVTRGQKMAKKDEGKGKKLLACGELLDYKMDDMDWQVLQDVEVVLEIPHAAQQSMSGESTPKLGGAIPAFEMFIEEWKRLKMGKRKAYIVAMFVDPTIHFTWIKEHWSLLNATKANQVIKDLMTEYRASGTPTGTVQDAPADQVPCNFPKLKLALHYYGVATVNTWHVNNLGSQTIDQEFITYVTASISPPGTNPLSFCQLSCTTYPTIFHIMMDYLPIQASSVPCECIFSTTNKCWNCISPILMEVLQMLKFFLKKEHLDFSKGWAVSQKDMLVDEDEDDLLAAIVDKNTSEDLLAQVVDNIIGAIAGDEGDKTADVPLIF
ncbi:hypothetical protein EV401DRAFT_2069113 [Pisolithus croceorrhizus]|nr:hypothetical protein EV401DRAFT_2069113 [Pisolithus croceorrhizus]